MTKTNEERIKELEQELKIKELEKKLDNKEDKSIDVNATVKSGYENDWNIALVIFTVAVLILLYVIVVLDLGE